MNSQMAYSACVLSAGVYGITIEFTRVHTVLQIIWHTVPVNPPNTSMFDPKMTAEW